MPLFREYHFTIFVEEQEGVHIAHALEAGMMATADDQEDAVNILGKMLVRHLEFAEKHDRPDQVYRNASADVLKRFEEARRQEVAQLVEEKRRYIGFDNQPKVRLNQSTYAAAC